MIFSIHIPKSGGTTFKEYLSQCFPGKVAFDYQRDKNKTIEELSEDTVALHGHFKSNHYKEYFTNARYITWLRNPTQIPISMYYYFLRSPDMENKYCAQLYEQNQTLEEFVLSRKDWNLATKFIDGKPLRDFDFVGIVEEYDTSIQIFNKIFNIDKEIAVELKNQNKSKPSKKYDIDPLLQKEIELYCMEDMRLYQEGQMHLKNLIKKFSIQDKS